MEDRDFVYMGRRITLQCQLNNVFGILDKDGYIEEYQYIEIGPGDDWIIGGTYRGARFDLNGHAVGVRYATIIAGSVDGADLQEYITKDRDAHAKYTDWMVTNRYLVDWTLIPTRIALDRLRLQNDLPRIAALTQAVLDSLNTPIN